MQFSSTKIKSFFFVIISISIVFSFSSFIKPISASGSGDWPPPIGTWIIDEKTVVIDETFSLGFPVVIQSGGSLTLEGCHIEVGGIFHGYVNITVEDGGTLEMNNTRIIPGIVNFAWFLYADAGASVDIQNSHLYNVKTPSFTDDFITIQSNETIFRDNTIMNTEGTGIYLGDYAHNSIISDNRISNCGKSGIDLQKSVNCTVNYNRISHVAEQGAVEAGISVWNCNNSRFNFNEVTDSKQRGIFLYSCENAIISGNDITTCEEEGIRCSLSRNITFSTNSILEVKKKSFDISQSDNTSYFDNEIINPESFGYYFSSCSPQEFENNSIDGEDALLYRSISNHIFEENATFRFNQLLLYDCFNISIKNSNFQGLLVDHTPYLMIKNNTVTNGGIITENSNHQLVKNNIISESGIGAISCRGNNNITVISNVIHNCKSTGININGFNANIIANTINMSSVGISASGENIQIALNKVYNIGAFGLHTSSFEDSIIYCNHFYNASITMYTSFQNCYIYLNAFDRPRSHQFWSTSSIDTDFYLGGWGNYWSDYDGLGPYYIEWEVYDYFPLHDLVTFWEHYKEFSAPYDEQMPEAYSEILTENITSATSTKVRTISYDDFGVKTTIFSYSIDNGITWYNISMTETIPDQWDATIPPGLPSGSDVAYKSFVSDYAGNTIVTEELYFHVLYEDFEDPLISVYYSTDKAVYNKEFHINTLITDESNIVAVILSYSTNGGLTWSNKSMQQKESNQDQWFTELTINKKDSGLVMVKVYATDYYGNKGVSSTYIVNLSTKAENFFSHPVVTIGLGALLSLIVIGLAYLVLILKKPKETRDDSKIKKKTRKK